MKNRYRVFRRGWGTFYYEDLVTRKQTTLGTRDKDEAFRLVAAKNETEDAPAFSLHMARVYWKASDPAAAQRTWPHVMDEIPKLKQGETQHRWLTAIKDKALESVRNLVVLEIQAEHFLKVLENGSISTNIYRIDWFTEHLVSLTTEGYRHNLPNLVPPVSEPQLTLFAH